MKQLLLITSLLITSQIFGQGPFTNEVEWGEAQKKEKNFQEWPDIIGEKDGKLFGVTRTPYSNYYIHEYDKSGLAVGPVKKLNLTYEKNKLEFMDAFLFGDEFTFITSFYNKKTKFKYFFIQHYIGDGELTEPKPIGKVYWANMPGLFSSMKKRIEVAEPFKINISENESYLSIVFPDIAVKEDGDENTWNGKVFNKDLSINWENQFTLDEGISVNSVKVSNQGVIYATSSDNEGSVHRAEAYRSVNYDNNNAFFVNYLIGDKFYLDILTAENYSHTDLKIEGQNFVGLSMDLKADKVVLYGIANNTKAEKMRSFIKILNLSGEELVTTYSEIGDDILSNEHYTTRWLSPKKKDKSLSRFFLKDLYLTDDGNLVFIAEEFVFYTTHTQTSTMGGVGGVGSTTQDQITYHYHYEDLLIFSYSLNGELNWMNRYEKFQSSTTDKGYYDSYYSIMDGNDLYILANVSEYSVNEEELDETGGKDKRKAKKNSIIALIKVDNSGEMTDDVLISDEKQNGNELCIRYGEIIDGAFYGTTRYTPPGLLHTIRYGVGKILME